MTSFPSPQPDLHLAIPPPPRHPDHLIQPTSPTTPPHQSRQQQKHAKPTSPRYSPRPSNQQMQQHAQSRNSQPVPPLPALFQLPPSPAAPTSHHHQQQQQQQPAKSNSPAQMPEQMNYPNPFSTSPPVLPMPTVQAYRSRNTTHHLNSHPENNYFPDPSSVDSSHHVSQSEVEPAAKKKKKAAKPKFKEWFYAPGTANGPPLSNTIRAPRHRSSQLETDEDDMLAQKKRGRRTSGCFESVLCLLGVCTVALLAVNAYFLRQFTQASAYTAVRTVAETSALEAQSIKQTPNVVTKTEVIVKTEKNLYRETVTASRS